MNNRYKITFLIVLLYMLSVLSGCKMVREIDVTDVDIQENESHVSMTDVPVPIVVEAGTIFDEESIVSYFYGENREDLLEAGYWKEQWYEETLIGSICEKDKKELIYNYQYDIEIDQTYCHFYFYDRSVNPSGEKYYGKLATGIKGFAFAYEYWLYQFIKEFPETDIESCTREEAMKACEPLAKACGYQDAQVKAYAIIDDFVGKKDPEAYVLLYRSVLNGMVLDTTRHCLLCIYVPAYDKVVYAQAQQPLVVKNVMEEKDLISKEEAIAAVVLHLQVESMEDVKIVNTTMVYSPKNKNVRADIEVKTIHPCWRIDYEVSEELLEKPVYEMYYKGGTMMIDAITGNVSEYFE